MLVLLGSAIAVLALPTGVARADHACGIPEGCDLDGDGVVETPGGALIPHGGDDDQYAEAPVVTPDDGGIAVNASSSDGETSAELADAGANGTSEATRVLPDTGGLRISSTLATGSVLLAVGCAGGVVLLVRGVAGSRR